MSINSFGDMNFRIDTNANGTNKFYWHTHSVGDNPIAEMTESGSFYSEGEVESYDTSDIRIKSKLKPLDDYQALENVLGWRTVEYWHKRKERYEIGLIAQDIYASYETKLVRNSKTEDLLQLDYGRTLAVGLSAIKAVNNKVEKTKSEVEVLREKVQKLENRIEELENAA
jgi:hypothetical protein